MTLRRRAEGRRFVVAGGRPTLAFLAAEAQRNTKGATTAASAERNSLSTPLNAATGHSHARISSAALNPPHYLSRDFLPPPHHPSSRSTLAGGQGHISPIPASSPA